MAAGPILAVLSQIPWGKVLEKAPDIADGAGRLWRSVSRRRSDDGAAERVEAAASDHADVADPVTRRLRAAERDIAQLHEQMQAASALIRDLTEQNAQLIRRADANRRGLLWLAWGAGLTVVSLAVALAVVLAPSSV